MKTRLSVEEQVLRRSLAWLGYDPGELSGDELRGVCVELEGPAAELNHAQAVVLIIARYDLPRCRPHGGDEVRCAGCQRPIVDELDWVLDRTLVMHRACRERFESTIQRARGGPMITTTATSTPMPIRCPRCSARAVLSVEGDPEPESATVTSIDAAGADIDLAVLSQVRGMAIIHLPATPASWTAARRRARRRRR